MANYLYEPEHIAARAEALRDPQRGRDVERREGAPPTSFRRVEKLIYLVWDRPSRAGAEVRTQFLDDVAPRLLALRRRAACRWTSTTTHADVASMVPFPATSSPCARCVSIWVDAHDDARAVRGDPAPTSVSDAPATS